MAGPGKNLYVFCRAARERTRRPLARMFADDLGVPKTPRRQRRKAAWQDTGGTPYFGTGPVDVRVEQGYE